MQFNEQILTEITDESGLMIKREGVEAKIQQLWYNETQLQEYPHEKQSIKSNAKQCRAKISRFHYEYASSFSKHCEIMLRKNPINLLCNL